MIWSPLGHIDSAIYLPNILQKTADFFNRQTGGGAGDAWEVRGAIVNAESAIANTRSDSRDCKSSHKLNRFGRSINGRSARAVIVMGSGTTAIATPL